MLAQALQLLTKNKLYATSNCFLSHVHVSHRKFLWQVAGNVLGEYCRF